MVIVDTNVLLYAFWKRFEQHETAKAWLTRALSGSERVGIASVAIVAYVRISTSGKSLTPALPTAVACEHIDRVLASPAATYLGDRAETWAFVKTQLFDYRVRGNLTIDAYLSALALEHDATIVTFDRDFARFTNIRKVFLG